MIPGRSSRKRKVRYDRKCYKDRDCIEESVRLIYGFTDIALILASPLSTRSPAKRPTVSG